MLAEEVVVLGLLDHPVTPVVLLPQPQPLGRVLLGALVSDLPLSTSPRRVFCIQNSKMGDEEAPSKVMN